MDEVDMAIADGERAGRRADCLDQRRELPILRRSRLTPRGHRGSCQAPEEKHRDEAVDTRYRECANLHGVLPSSTRPRHWHWATRRRSSPEADPFAIEPSRQ